MTQETKERPILFSSEMVRAILDGRKTQTRRIIKCGVVGRMMSDDQKLWPYTYDKKGKSVPVVYPYGQPGNLLWVRETWQRCHGCDYINYLAYVNKGPHCQHCDDFINKWKPSIHMPRWASRITLEVTGVRVERVRDVSRDDAIAEGLPSFVSNLGARNSSPTRLYQTRATDEGGYSSPIEAFENLWNTINAKRGYSWDSNPWVWVVEFKRVQP